MVFARGHGIRIWSINPEAFYRPINLRRSDLISSNFRYPRPIVPTFFLVLFLRAGPSFGGDVAVEIAKQLATMHINVVGDILVDSPSPKYRVLLSAAIVSPNAVGRVTEAVKLTKQQFLITSPLHKDR